MGIERYDTIDKRIVDGEVMTAAEDAHDNDDNSVVFW
jgi:hypothetical protein